MVVQAKRKTAKRKRKQKLKSIPQINRRLFRITSVKCRERAGDKCEICGMMKGTILESSGKPQRVEAHHVFSRNHKDSPLKWDLRNLICLCTKHHKTSRYSAHLHGLWFAKWFFENRKEDADFILNNDSIQVNLRNRENLEYIEHCLKNNINFDYCKLEK